MTQEDVLAVTGPLEDHFVVEILGVGGSRGELVDAVSRARGDEAALLAGASPISAIVSRLCAIIEAADAAATDPLEWEDERL